MDVVVEEVSGLTKKVTITLPKKDVQKKLNKAYDKLQKESKMKGFRRGKVPRTIIIRSYKGQVEGEVGEKLVQDTYFDAIEKESIDPVVHPEIQNVTYSEDGAFTYVAHVDIRPEFELADYKGLEIEKSDIEIQDAEVDAEIETTRASMAPLRSVTDRAIETGDIAVIDFQGFHNGHPMKQVQNDNFTVDVGKGMISAEFEEKLIGMNKGDEGSHEVSFNAKDPNPMLAGKTVDFKVVVKDIKEKVLPEIDDEFAKDVSEDYSTLADLKNAVRKKLADQKEEKAEGDMTDKVMLKLVEAHTFDLPQRLVKFEIEEMIKETEKSLEQGGLSLEAAGISRDDLAEKNRETAEKRVRGDFILKKIAEKEDIKVQDEDIDRGFKRIGDKYNMDVAQVKQYFQSRDDMLPFMNEILNEKILAFLRKESVVVDAPADETADETA